MRFNELDQASVDYVLTTTRATRKRLDLSRPVDPQLIEECLEIGFQAPSAANLQTLRWIVVTDPELRRRIAAHYRRVHEQLAEEPVPYGTVRFLDLHSIDPADWTRLMSSSDYLDTVLDRVPVLAIACHDGVMPTRFDPTACAAVYGSIFPAVWNFQIALRSRGLASVLTTAHLAAAAAIGEILELPESFMQVCMIPIAYSIGTEFVPGRRKATADVVSWNRWGDGRRT